MRAAPGIYYVKDGDVVISGTSNVIFDQATLYLSGTNLCLSVEGNSRLVIAAPQSGPTADVAVAMDPARGAGKQTFFRGRLAGLHCQARFMSPKQKLVISGDSVGVAELENAMLIAAQIDFGGGAQWKWTNTDRLPYIRNDVSVQLIRLGPGFAEAHTGDLGAWFF